MKSIHIIFRIILIASFALIVIVSACKKDPPEQTPLPVDPYPVPANLTLLGNTYAIGAAAMAKVYIKGPIITGYNEIYIALYDSITNARITNSHIHLEPLMQMTSMSHSCPVENPEEDAVQGLFKGVVYFPMASSPGNTWTLGLHVHNHINNLEGEAELEINVTNALANHMLSLSALNNGSKYFVSLIKPDKPVTGINDFVIAIHENDATNEYAPIEDYKVIITPTMPSMGHGSPNNIDPTHTSNGHYNGKVNFTMNGLWRIKLLISQDSAIVDSTAYFDVSF